jgi:probable F420-dependent oxidoreductase
MLKVAMNLYGLQDWFDGDFAAVVELVKIAERKGVDQISLGDHVAIGEDHSNYPFGKFSAPLDFPWIEPITMLAAVASATTRIRLSAGVLISPLRPAVLLAKQLASLDVLSRGRLDIGIGTGWQQAEYDACGVPFADRVLHMEEQVRVCRELWRNAPATFHGKYVNFDRLYSLPRPVQPNGAGIWFGVPPTPRNFARIAELGDGWLPLGIDVAQFAAGMQALRAACAERDRDPATLAVRHLVIPPFGPDGIGDFDGALAGIRAWAAAGATMVELFPTMFCRGRDDFEPFLDRLVALKQ